MSRKTSKLLLDEQPLQVLPTLAMKLGLNRAMFVQQLHYWLQKATSHVRSDEAGTERRWVYNTFEGWHEQFPFWTPEAIRKIVGPLIAKGIILSTERFNERKGDRTKWYSIDYEALNELLNCLKEASETPPENRPVTQKHPENRPDQPENRPPLEPDKSTQRYQRLPETNNRDSPRGANAPDPKPKPETPAKAMTTLTVDRTREVGFDAATHQKANWGKGWSAFCYVAEGQEPPSAERQYAVLGEIVVAASGKGGKARYFLSVEDAAKRVEGAGRGGATTKLFGGRDGEPARDTSRSRAPENENPYDLQAHLEAKRRARAARDAS